MRPVEHIIYQRIRYGETDQMGVYYHSRAFEWFECGRTELLRAMGCVYTEMEAKGFFLPVTEAHAEFLGKARYDDLLKITATAAMQGRASIRFNVSVERADGGQPVCNGYTVHAIVDANGRPVRPPKWLVDRIQAGAAQS